MRLMCHFCNTISISSTLSGYVCAIHCVIRYIVCVICSINVIQPVIPIGAAVHVVQFLCYTTA